MALVVGNKTIAVGSLPWPATSVTFSHNQNAGDDKYLIISFTMQNTVNFSGCTYDGIAMTLIDSNEFSGLSQRWACYGIAPTTSGAKNVVLSFGGSPQWGPVSYFACSFLGSSGIGNTGVNGRSSTPNSQTLTVSEGSAIFATGISNNAFTGIDIDGSARPLEFQHNTNKQVSGALSLIPLSAGSIAVDTKVTFSNVTNARIEILAGGAPPSTNSNFLVMF